MIKLIPVFLICFFNSFTIFAQEDKFDLIYDYMAKREYEEALKIINTELVDSTNDQEQINALFFNKGMIYEFQDEIDSAIWFYEEVLFTDSLHIPSLNSLGMLYGDFEYYEEAYQLFYKLIEIDSSLILPYSNIIYYKGLEGNYSEALKIAKEVLPLSTDSIEIALILNNLSFAQYNLNQLEDAYRSVTSSLKYLEENSYAYRNLGLIYLKQEKIEKACDNFQRSLDLGGTEDIYILIQDNCED